MAEQGKRSPKRASKPKAKPRVSTGLMMVAGGTIADTTVATTRGDARGSFGLNQSARKKRR